ncbi:TetR/AcrR family transcriptional regulator [Streptomyces sp. NPDC001985]|uniref:TetR/AcrR family transcriptional regulator n=1 Tax=Streptomyces sp. NPDC001985 TaxID=3154406 RepID=UPI003323054F
MTTEAIGGRPPRGRPRTVTRKAVIEAGIALTLDEVTVQAVAESLGVTRVALYKHVPSQASLRLLVAEGILERWSPPDTDGESVEDFLLALAVSLRALVTDHPGIAGYLSQLQSGSRVSMARFEQTHLRLVRLGLEPWQASWMASTVAQQAIAATAVFGTPASRTQRTEVLAQMTPEFSVFPIKHVHARELGDDAVFLWTMRGLVRGCLASLTDDDPRPAGAPRTGGPGIPDPPAPTALRAESRPPVW